MVLRHLMEAVHCLCNGGNNGGEIGGTRQANIEKCLLIRVQDPLNTMNTWRGRSSVKSEAMARHVAHEASEAIGSKQLAGVVALKNFADRCNSTLIPVDRVRLRTGFENKGTETVLVEMTRTHEVQRPRVRRRAVASREVHSDKHAHFQATRQVVNKAGYGMGGGVIKQETPNILILALKAHHFAEM